MTFFATRDRQRVAYEILAQTIYGKKKRAEVGIDRLVEEGAFAAAFPLHDVSISIKSRDIHERPSCFMSGTDININSLFR